MHTLSSLIIFVALVNSSFALWCFECVSTQPGCGDDFNYYFMWSHVCKEDNDICVKIEETKGAEKVITRSCLSRIKAIRTDIPPDTYEGTRLAAKDVKLGHYVNNSIKELDIHRTYYDKIEYSFCFLDHRCNSAPTSFGSNIVVVIMLGAITILAAVL
ncbi:PREDICTED: uncharacterized protein LOC108558494 [Nicrophorus vespilloides]|uniref:Uncharacterized protein LOC108558494 n=1 Tax=Nicrophorus vespilloides TaxID=110193 RepID=A0ABM1M8K2_NICVS|nr:PREDICTED: uncharacterized protein LOC108558494 [Nicrophorus vespilloides]